MECIEARVFVPITAQYTEEEITKMSTFQARRVEDLGLLKVTGEEHVATLKSTDIDEIRKQVIELCEQYHLRPLCVLLNTTLNRTFLVDKRYYEYDPNTIYELIYFSYGGGGEEVLKFVHSRHLELGEILRSKYGIDPNDISYENKWMGREALHDEIMEFIFSYTDGLTSEVESRFGFKDGRFKNSMRDSSTEDQLGQYTTTSEISIREQGLSGWNAQLYESLEEKCRFICKDLSRSAVSTVEYYTNYYRKVHPELIGPFSIDNLKIMSSKDSRFPSLNE